MKMNQLRTMYFVFTILLVIIFELSSGSLPYFQFIEKGIEKSNLGHICREDAECIFGNSACIDDRCGCVGGFEQSWSHEEDTCVPGTLYLTTDYQLKSLQWTDTLKNKESKEYEALINRLETEMRKKTGDLFIDLPEAYFSPSDDEKVVASLGYHMKNPMVIKANRLTRETHTSINRNRRQGDPDFITDLISAITAAATAQGIIISGITSTIKNGPLGKYCDGDCGIEHAACVSNTCRCQDGYVHLEGDDETCHPSVDLNGACSADGECGDNQVCDVVCSCEDGAVEIWDGTECGMSVGLDGPCTDHDQCIKPGSACFGTCLCVSGDREGDRCSGAPTTTAPMPTTSPECGTVLGAICSPVCLCAVDDSICAENVCVCDSRKVDVDGICKQRMNLLDACEDVKQCPELAACTDSVCICSDEAVEIPGVGCAELADLGASCTYDEQCTTNAHCNGTSSTCECIDTFAFSYADENTCVPEEVTVVLEFNFGTWNANMATVGSTEYNAQKTELETLVSNAEPLFLRMENLVITADGVNAKNTFDATFINEDTVPPSRHRRDAKEPFEIRLVETAKQRNQPLTNLKITRK